MIMSSACIESTSVDSRCGTPAESNRCPATGSERNTICVPRTAVQTNYFWNK